MIIEIPDIDTVVLGDKDNAWACGTEGAAGVLRTTSVCRSEDGLFTIQQTDLPNSEVEVMDRQQEVVVEGRSL